MTQELSNRILLELFDRFDPASFMLCLEEFFGIKVAQA
jgi:hypothetical protein